MKDNIRWTINDVVHTENAEWNGGPQVDFEEERELFGMTIADKLPEIAV